MEVSDTRALARVLDQWQVEYNILSETEAEVFETVNLTKLVHALDKENGEVISADQQDESLESYYLSLVGGKEHE